MFHRRPLNLHDYELMILREITRRQDVRRRRWRVPVDEWGCPLDRRLNRDYRFAVVARYVRLYPFGVPAILPLAPPGLTLELCGWSGRRLRLG